MNKLAKMSSKQKWLEPPQPTLDYSKSITEPASVMKLYRRRHSCSLFFAYFFTLASLCFEVYLPLLAGELIEIGRERDSEGIDDEAFREKRAGLI